MFTASPRSPRGVFRGIVVAATPRGWWVHVPHLNDTPGHAYGPLEHLEFPGTPGIRTSTESGGSGDPAFAPHDHGVRPLEDWLQVGDRVLVAAIDGRPDDLIIVGRIVANQG